MTINKRIIPLLALLELKKSTDENHPISQAKLRETLAETYDLEINRNVFHEIVESLMTETLPSHWQVKNKAQRQYSSLYTENYFSYAEMDFLLDVIYFARDLNFSQKEGLMKKLMGLMNDAYEKEHKNLNVEDLKNDQGLADYYLRYATVQQAIFDRKQIQYRSQSGNRHNVSPLALMRTNETVMLLSRVENKNHVVPLALYNLNELKILKTPAETTRGLVDIQGNFNLKRFVDTHHESWSGTLYSVRIAFNPRLRGNIARDFAPPENSYRQDALNHQLLVTIQSTKNAIVRYALENIEALTVLSPPAIVEEITQRLTLGLEKYQTP